MTRLRRRELLGSVGAALSMPLVLRPGTARAQTGRLSTLDMPSQRMPLKLDDTVAEGYRRDVLVRWGDRVTYDAAVWSPYEPTPSAAATQFGWDARICGMVVPPIAADGVPRALLAVAHPWVEPILAFPDGRDRPGVSAMMQGASLLNIARQGGRWTVVDGGYQSRRLTAGTLCRMSGPAAGAVGGLVQGLLGPTGGCATPWGTILLGEGDPMPWLARLAGLDQRFSQPNRFGWVAELDPLDPGALPCKRTALGRFPHADLAASSTRDGRAAIYMADAGPGNFLFRFLSDGPGAERDALDRGEMSVAQMSGSRLRWLPLPRDPALLFDPTEAARALGATGFDLPSGLVVDPGNGVLYMACRGRARVPQAPPGQRPVGGSGGGMGMVLEVAPDGGDHASSTGTANILLVGGSPEAHLAPLARSWPTAPASVSVDGAGRLWVGSDHRGRPLDTPDVLFGVDTAGQGRGLALPIYAAPIGAAIGGSAMTPDGTTLF
ncbi:PhoX family protein, partial [Pseudoroseomonas globiformis]